MTAEPGDPNLMIRPDPKNPRECRPAAQLRELWAQDERFHEEFQTRLLEFGSAKGNAHDLAMLTVTGLWNNGVHEGWDWVVGHFGDIRTGRSTSWLESDGWVFYADQGRAWFVDATVFQETRRAQSMKRRTLAEAHWWFSRHLNADPSSPEE